ncbi:MULTISPECIES: RodZ family helix-turn-helix domain-containing protein [unclassified Paenibacillus]|uniref:helix-turn-helix domain-containing protein n=1 Tax=unclassified Paenibacillus TaxID=185978 RepID=UPI0024071831|nr:MULTISPECIES: RodZ family helix-turn-helix domain-containing protein [unclassified Paenibacillus]MDF9841313.1 cytoskeletal protein RodZ [Paenibacillus sp. PastF-2]MDF9847904.1 cytoskeletal protein RodZ [Paenibacillus sp. PastM-2]MDF9854472.1 cytoskeletal protein RodZ [Paenibacillus sp. PastF-1]MDH6479919.1 cytoskeletal protein RodZ [Paenibacillus sp. PastH-2]MDH6507179.1 cytoskeletal protein RodZ [Paenibacillus sp. PastM-3]
MSELGRHLKEARLQKGMSLDDVQEVTKIRKKYLEAIEAGDYKVLPGSFYVRAFIKTYAEAVGVNPDELMEEHGNVPAAPVDTTMETVIQKRSRRTETERNAKWLPTVLMWTFPVLIIAVIYWYASSNMNQSDPETVDSSNVTNEQQDPSKIQPSPTAVGGGIVSNSPPAGGDSAATATASPTIAPTATPVPSPTAGPVTVTEDRKSGKTTIFKVTASSGTPVEVKIAATGTSWLEVYNGKNSQGEKLSFGNTAAGDSLSFTLGAEGMYIKSGYSPATTITVNGQEITDGKTSSRLLLELDSAASGGTE